MSWFWASTVKLVPISVSGQVQKQRKNSAKTVFLAVRQSGNWRRFIGAGEARLAEVSPGKGRRRGNISKRWYGTISGIARRRNRPMRLAEELARVTKKDDHLVVLLVYGMVSSLIQPSSFCLRLPPRRWFRPCDDHRDSSSGFPHTA